MRKPELREGNFEGYRHEKMNLDGLTILRFAHAFESGGGVEQYLEDIDTMLLSRNKLQIVRMHLSEKPAQDRRQENIRMGTLIKIPLVVDHAARQINADKQIANEKWRNLIKYAFRDWVVYNSFLYKAVFQDIVRKRYPRRMAVEAINARQEVETVFREYRIDLVIMHYAGGRDSAAIINAAQMRGIPYIIINHFSNSHLNGISFREQSSGSAGIAGVSSVGVPHWLKMFFNISDGVDMAFFKQELARPMLSDLNANVIIYPARIVRNKGQVDLIKACARLRRAGIRTKLILAGHTDCLQYDSELKLFVKNNGLEDDVFFVGQLNREELRNWYATSSVLAFPTYHEALGRAIIEAQAMKVPAIVYNVGGTSEAVIDGKTGYLVRKGDIRSFTMRLGELLTDKNKRRAMGEDGRRFVEKCFSLEALADRHEKYYLQVLKNAGK